MAILGKSATMKIMTASSTDLINGLCIKEIGDFSATAGEVDATCHGSQNIRKKIKGLVDLGTITVTVDYKDVTTSQAIFAELTGGDSRTIKIILKDGTSSDEVLTFSGFISGVSETHPLEDVIRTTITITLDGQTIPSWSTE